jgi:hypothetical protein
MPTGVLRDVWLALSSLENRERREGDHCKLDRVWVRWHDNSDSAPTTNSQVTISSSPTSHYPTGSVMNAIGLVESNLTGPLSGQQSLHHTAPSFVLNRVECPTLSVLPPLKSISVLDIDELAYLDEMSFLIQRSQHKLRELRVGISSKAALRPWAWPWDGPYHQVDHGTRPPTPSTISEKRLGGVLGVLVGRICDVRKKPKSKVARNGYPEPVISTNHEEASLEIAQPMALTTPETPTTSMGHTLPLEAATDAASPGDTAESEVSGWQADSPTDEVLASAATATSSIPGPKSTISDDALGQRPHLTGRLRLQVLELERVNLSITVLQKAFDWSMLTSLTILECMQHESLWRMLRRQFQPQVSPSSALAASTMLRENIASTHSKQIANVPMEYQLNLKKLHTDAATPALISFLKDTLAPNTLEVLFLQDKRRSQGPSVTIDTIYKCVLKRQRGSLRKLMLDSSDKPPRGPNNSNDGNRWRAWMPNREVLSFITSGKMCSLRELGIAIDYKDWV